MKSRRANESRDREREREKEGGEGRLGPTWKPSTQKYDPPFVRAVFRRKGILGIPQAANPRPCLRGIFAIDRSIRRRSLIEGTLNGICRTRE